MIKKKLWTEMRIFYKDDWGMGRSWEEVVSKVPSNEEDKRRVNNVTIFFAPSFILNGEDVLGGLHFFKVIK